MQVALAVGRIHLQCHHELESNSETVLGLLPLTMHPPFCLQTARTTTNTMNHETLCLLLMDSRASLHRESKSLCCDFLLGEIPKSFYLALFCWKRGDLTGQLMKKSLVPNFVIAFRISSFVVNRGSEFDYQSVICVALSSCLPRIKFLNLSGLLPLT